MVTGRVFRVIVRQCSMAQGHGSHSSRCGLLLKSQLCSQYRTASVDNLGCGMTIFVIPFQDNYGQNASVESSPVQLKWSMTESIPKSPTVCVATTGHANLNLPPPTF